MSGELVGPLQPVRYNGGHRTVVTWADLPRNTCDIRYAACGSHHLACDCREAQQAEDISEYRAMYRELETAILAAIRGHQTYAYDAWGWDDELAQCKCQACGIARAAHIGFTETLHQRLAADAAANEAAADRAREAARYYRMFPDLDEVPF